jgi:hypothetical protein
VQNKLALYLVPIYIYYKIQDALPVVFLKGKKMKTKKIDEMNLSEIKHEILISREKDKNVLADLDSLINTINQIKQKYGFIEATETVEGAKQNAAKKTQREEIIDILKTHGELTSEGIFEKLFERGVIKSKEYGLKNLPSLISRMTTKGYISHQGKGKPWKLLKEL